VQREITVEEIEEAILETIGATGSTRGELDAALLAKVRKTAEWLKLNNDAKSYNALNYLKTSHLKK